ncbi:MAG: hypothetical protein CSA62_08230 [Planctomycetota bacterium]|nr:MAG: hypothetical protein CSA62_08230 [Planctomycetota bacterium]
MPGLFLSPRPCSAFALCLLLAGCASTPQRAPTQPEPSAKPALLYLERRESLRIGIEDPEFGRTELLRLRSIEVMSRDPHGRIQRKEWPLRFSEQSPTRLSLSNDEHAFALKLSASTAQSSVRVQLEDHIGSRHRVERISLQYEWARGPLGKLGQHLVPDELAPCGFLLLADEAYAAMLLALPGKQRRLPRFLRAEGGASPRLIHGLMGSGQWLEDEKIGLEHELLLWKRSPGISALSQALHLRHQRLAAAAAAQQATQRQSFEAELRKCLQATEPVQDWQGRGFGPGELARSIEITRNLGSPEQKAAALSLLASSPRSGRLFATRRVFGPNGPHWGKDADDLYSTVELCELAASAWRLSGGVSSSAAKTIRARAEEFLDLLQRDAALGELPAQYRKNNTAVRSNHATPRRAWIAAAELALALRAKHPSGSALIQRVLQWLALDPTPLREWSSDEVLRTARLAQAQESTPAEPWLLEAARRQRLASLPLQHKPFIGSIGGGAGQQAPSLAPDLFWRAWQSTGQRDWLDRCILALYSKACSREDPLQALRLSNFLHEHRGQLAAELAREPGVFAAGIGHVQFRPTRSHPAGRELRLRLWNSGPPIEATLVVEHPAGSTQLSMQPGPEPGELFATVPASLVAEVGTVLHCHVEYRSKEGEARVPFSGSRPIHIGTRYLADCGDDDEPWLMRGRELPTKVTAEGRSRARKLPIGAALDYYVPLPGDVTVVELRARHSGALRIRQLGSKERYRATARGPGLQSSRWRVPVYRNKAGEPWKLRFEAAEAGVSLDWFDVRILQSGSAAPEIGERRKPTRQLPQDLHLQLLPLRCGPCQQVSQERLRLLLYGKEGGGTGSSNDSFADWLASFSNARVHVFGSVEEWRTATDLPPISASAQLWQQSLPRLHPSFDANAALTVLLLAGQEGDPRTLALSSGRKLWLIPYGEGESMLLPKLVHCFLDSQAPIPETAKALLAMESPASPLGIRLQSAGLASEIEVDIRQHRQLRLPAIGSGSFGLRMSSPGAHPRCAFRLEHRRPADLPGWQKGGALLSALLPENTVLLHRNGKPLRPPRIVPYDDVQGWLGMSAPFPGPLRLGNSELVTAFAELAWHLELHQSAAGESRLGLRPGSQRWKAQELLWLQRSGKGHPWLPRPAPATDASQAMSVELPPGSAVRLQSQEPLARGGSRLSLRASRRGPQAKLNVRIFLLDQGREQEILHCPWPAKEKQLALEAWLPAALHKDSHWLLELRSPAAQQQTLCIDELWSASLTPPILDLLTLAPEDRVERGIPSAHSDGWRRGPALRLGGQDEDRLDIPVSIPPGLVLGRLLVEAPLSGAIPDWSLEFVPSKGSRREPLIARRRPHRGQPKLHLIDLRPLAGRTGFLVFRSHGSGAPLRLLFPSLRRR